MIIAAMSHLILDILEDREVDKEACGRHHKAIKREKHLTRASPGAEVQ